MRPFLSLDGRIALVTGAARGLGAATARLFVQAGARVVVTDVDGAGAAALADELGPAASAAALDVRDAAAVARVITEGARRHGGLDILVNNAGVLRDAFLEKTTDEAFDLSWDVNTRGAFLCTRAAVPHLKARGRGRILSASSVVARNGNIGQTAYIASKAALIGMTRGWARELGPFGITANAVAPGIIDTDMARQIPPRVLEKMLARIAAGRLGRPAEVAAAYLYLASDEAAFVNGAVLGVDGGMML